MFLSHIYDKMHDIVIIECEGKIVDDDVVRYLQYITDNIERYYSKNVLVKFIEIDFCLTNTMTSSLPFLEKIFGIEKGIRYAFVVEEDFDELEKKILKIPNNTLRRMYTHPVIQFKLFKKTQEAIDWLSTF